MSAADELKDMLLSLQYTPSNIQMAVLDMLSEETKMVDPTNPFMFSLETSAVLASVTDQKNESMLRALYPKLATDYSELYRHMSDSDFFDRFASPAKNVTIVLLLAEDEIQRVAEVDPASGVRKLVIPGDTEIEVEGHYFYGHFPIFITLQSNGGYQIVYDLSTESPLREETTNSVKWTRFNMNGRTLLAINIPMDQLKHSVSEYAVSPSVGFNVDIPFEDSYHYAQVYHQNGNGDWIEIYTTHSDMVYDTSRVTAVLTHNDGSLNVRIPDVYFSKEMVGSSIKVRLYSTKGAIKKNLSEVGTESFSVKFRDYDKQHNLFVSPLSKLGFVQAYCENNVEGGYNGLTFEELKERVIYGTLGKPVPVLKDELESQLTGAGYQLSVIKESILGRLYLATRRIPNDSMTRIGTIGSSIALLNFDDDRTDLPDSLRKNELRVTITPNALFERVDGGFTVRPDSMVTAISQMNRDTLIETLNTRELFYQPFHVVLDSTEGTFRVRTYDLNNPRLSSRSFVDNNATLGFTVNTRSVEVTADENGYEIRVIADIPDGIQGLFLQAVFTSPISGERWFASIGVPTIEDDNSAEFILPVVTSFDVNTENRFQVTNLLDAQGNPASAFLPLTTTMDFIYVVESDLAIPTMFDNKFSRALHDNPVVGVTYEKAAITFGSQLKRYYATGRSIIKPPVYQRHPVDVYQTYPETIYARDLDGNILFTTDGAGNVEFTVVHSQGDLVLDENNEPIIQHAAGSYVYDVDGNAVVIGQPGVMYELTIPVFDAKYRYASTPGSVALRDSIPGRIAGYVLGDIESFSKRLLERTEMPFSPTNTNTNAMVVYADNTQDRMDTAIPFEFKFTMTDRGYREESIRDAVSNIVYESIKTMLDGRTISSSQLYRTIMSKVSDDVIALEIKPFVRTGYARLVNSYDAFSVASRLSQLSNGTIEVEDDITIGWVNAEG